MVYQLVNSISQSSSWEIYAAKTYYSCFIRCHKFAWFSDVIKTKAVNVAFLQQRGGLHNRKNFRTCGNPVTLNICDNSDRWWYFVRGCRTEVGLQKYTLDSSNLPFTKDVLFIAIVWVKNQQVPSFASMNWALIKTLLFTGTNSRLS